MTTRGGSRARDTGSGTVLAMAVLMVTSLFGVVALLLAQVAALRHHAGSAADLAALAAAGRVLEGGDVACAEAAQVAASYQVRLASCELSAAEVTVLVRVAAPGRLGFLGELTARSRAGPVGLPGGVE